LAGKKPRDDGKKGFAPAGPALVGEGKGGRRPEKFVPEVSDLRMGESAPSSAVTDLTERFDRAFLLRDIAVAAAAAATVVPAVAAAAVGLDGKSKAETLSSQFVLSMCSSLYTISSKVGRSDGVA
jgi:hypothetical protein